MKTILSAQDPMRKPGTVIAAITLLAGTMVMAAGPRPQEEQATGPFANIKVTPVAATWQYSNDGGKTFANQPHPGPPAMAKPHHKEVSYPFVWKGEFQIADPANTGGLWVRIFDERPDGKPSAAAICNGDIDVAGCGYWKNLGYCPTVLDATVTFNGKEVQIAHGALLQFWVPLTDGLLQGRNTVEIRGNVYTYWMDQSAKALEARIIAADPQPAEIYGPIAGDAGDDYFTLTCRTQLPAELTVEATLLEPAAPAVTDVSTCKIWHRVKVGIPKATRKVSYTLSAKVGACVTKRGPFTLTLQPTDKEYRFVAYGNAFQHSDGEPWGANSKQILKAAPAFVVNTGNPVEMGCWLFSWDKGYISPAAGLLASVPNLATPCNLDRVGMFNEIHYTPAADGYSHNWTKVVGSARFIGLDSNELWAPGNANYKWLEGVLADAKDKFIVVLCGHPGYSSGNNSKKPYGALGQCREVIMPLLGKYKATLVLSGWDHDYERLEPTPDKGVTQIVTGCIGFKTSFKWATTLGSHPFGPGPNGPGQGIPGLVKLPDGREWAGQLNTRHFCVFDVKDNSIEMKVLACGVPPDADTKDLQVLDQKTFKPRQ